MIHRVPIADGLELEVEDHPGDGPPLLLIMGLGAQMIHWPDGLVDAFVAAGHRVIRFDNRDVGRSSRLDHEGTPGVITGYLAARLGRPRTPPYTLADMADDAVAVLDHLDIERATVVGASMGGMIAQRMAIAHRDRMDALVSIMSAVGAARPDLKAVWPLLRRPVPTREGYQDATVGLFSAIGSQTHGPAESELREFAGRVFDRGPSPGGFSRQLAAILAESGRSAALQQVNLPAVVIHGAQDPLIPVRYGRHSARVLGARFEIHPEMAHDLPDVVWPRIVTSVSDLAHANRSGLH